EVQRLLLRFMSRKNNKKQVLEQLLVEDYAAEGKSLSRVNGKVIFIEGAVPGDVVDVLLGKNKKDWAEGKAIRFAETDVRCMGRTAKGVRGIRIGNQVEVDPEDTVDASSDADEQDDSNESCDNSNSRVVSLVVVPENGEVLTACANGYGKRTPVGDYPTKRRGGKGVIAIKTSERNGELVGAVSIDEHRELLLISNGGTMVRTRAAEIATTGRNAQGVRLIRVDVDEVLVGVVSVAAIEDDDLIDVVDETSGEVSDESTSELADAEANTEASTDSTDAVDTDDALDAEQPE
ncbi:MAG: hypothetical protein EOO68_33430, partial [Moraxellaceae bacterium]